MFDRARATHRRSIARTLDHTMGLHSAPVPDLLAARRRARRDALALATLTATILFITWHLHPLTTPVALFPMVPTWWEAASARAITREIAIRPEPQAHTQ